MNDSGRESACMKILKENAAPDRVILDFPPPFLSTDIDNTITDFDPSVKEVLALDKSVRSCLKISKTIIVGDVGVGKTCLVHRFCHDIFDSNYKATIGVDFEVERFDILHTPFNLQIWDTAGQERFRCIAQAYYRGAQVVIIVFDLSNLLTLQNSSTWLEQALQNNNESPLIFLVGTKMDLISQATYSIVEAEAAKFARSINAEYWAVSSKNNDNVNNLFYRVAALAFTRTVLKEISEPNRKIVYAKDFATINVDNQNVAKTKKKKCNC